MRLATSFYKQLPLDKTIAEARQHFFVIFDKIRYLIAMDFLEIYPLFKAEFISSGDRFISRIVFNVHFLRFVYSSQSIEQ